ncbi:AAA family ATPase [Rhodobacter sp. KR11]|uniref:YhaN family protein n=1 Tax=Rhodobacter sp. KR11 TaxID=2974588 RepID=UPI002221312B|nr:YhaN family protein [Rhodobacter sp. KR11]MCW1918145.1 AAA family ATPase [Rhodobacter sp. KR11]
MRLNRLDLTRYGRFTDRRLDFPAPEPGAPDLNILYGPNEAGKSTLFSAWLDLLYGIPMQSRYAFLHPGPTMQIGASLTGLDILRVKKNAGSLQDASGQPLPEAALQAALGGLTREAYQAMFSLDDDTLEQGGEAILSSRGDLGEMLFSASAGLSALAPQLEGVRRELDAFHKPRARASTLKLTKDRLADLDRQRRELDVTAAAAQGLARAVSQAERTWTAAREAEAAIGVTLDGLRRALALVPQQARAERLAAELQALSHLPDLTEADAAEDQALTQELRALQGQLIPRAEAVAQAEARLTGLARDPVILPLAEAIAQAQALYPLHQSATLDLPKRRDALSGLTADLARQMAALGLAGDPAAHVLPAPVLARLRALLTRREALGLAATQAAEELRRAEEKRASLPQAAATEDLASLAHLMADLRAQDPEAQVARAAETLAQREADLAAALLRLAPWTGSPTALGALTPPSAWDLDAWTRDAAQTRAALSDAAHALTRAQGTASDAPALTEALDARSQREALWALHLADLSVESARAFEAALRHDDRTNARLAEAALAATAQAALARARDAHDQAQAAHDAVTARIAAAALALDLPGAGPAELATWCEARTRALTALTARDAALAALTQAQTALARAAAVLAQALGHPPADLPLLRAEALALLDRAARQNDAARQRTEAEAELATRQAALTRAETALTDWRADWTRATEATPLQARASDDAGLAAVLDGLDTLARTAAEAAELAHRIAGMEDNSAAFHRAAARALPPDTAWEGLADRLNRAQEAERAHVQATADLAQARAAQDSATRALQAIEARRAALALRVGCDIAALSDHIAQGLQAARLRRDLAELRAELGPELGAESGQAPPQDPEALARQAADQEAHLALARAETEAAFAALTEARRALAAVGGDDAVARIAFDRANLVNDLAEAARAHLGQRLALMAFEAGLRRYRESHRSAMLARASEAFSRLSQGAYRGLDAQPEGGSEVLVALPAQGGAKLAADLSKGTRFQLYLALRIAGYHEMARSRPPVPFIADDIMETFDDGRSEQAFLLLAEMAQTGQVIYLTHHEHLARLAVQACPGARVQAL